MSSQGTDACPAPPEVGDSHVHVWDTSYYAPKEAFSVYRDEVCGALMPWSIEPNSEYEFKARFESVEVETGVFGRLRSIPHTAIRTPSNIANSSMECFYVVSSVSGEFAVDQGGRSVIAKPSDIAVYDSELPTRFMHGESLQDALGLVIPKNLFSNVKNAEDVFRNILLRRNNLFNPLSNCLSFMANNMLSSTNSELNALFDVCISLLPVIANGVEGHRQGGRESDQSRSLVRAVFCFVDGNLSNPRISARQVAERFGISQRYVHKMFATSGVTFSAYVVHKRLVHVCADLLSPECSKIPIYEIAYRWGFNDLSAFHRSFKLKFACSPGHFRKRFGN